MDEILGAANQYGLSIAVILWILKEFGPVLLKRQQAIEQRTFNQEDAQLAKIIELYERMLDQQAAMSVTLLAATDIMEELRTALSDVIPMMISSLESTGRYVERHDARIKALEEAYAPDAKKGKVL